MTREDLRRIQPALRARGLSAEYVPADERSRVEQLLVISPGAGNPRPAVTLAFVPLAPDAVPHAKLLQFFHQFPFTARAGVEPVLQALILRLNNELPLMGLGYIETDRFVYFRHVLLMRPDELPLEVVLEALTMCFFIAERYGPQLAAAAKP